MTLVEFLRARLDDRHARASKLLRYAQENDVAVRDPRLLGRTIPGWHEWPEVERMAREVLAEVDAKRRIVALYVYCRDHVESPYDNARLEVLEDVMRLLALPYADQPDYDESWRPA